MLNKDEVAGKTDQVKGKVKQAIGKATDNPDLEDEGVVDTYVHYLRRKLHRGVIETVRGLGYRLGTS